MLAVQGTCRVVARRIVGLLPKDRVCLAVIAIIVCIHLVTQCSPGLLHRDSQAERLQPAPTTASAGPDTEAAFQQVLLPRPIQHSSTLRSCPAWPAEGGWGGGGGAHSIICWVCAVRLLNTCLQDILIFRRRCQGSQHQAPHQLAWEDWRVCLHGLPVHGMQPQLQICLPGWSWVCTMVSRHCLTGGHIGNACCQNSWRLEQEACLGEAERGRLQGGAGVQGEHEQVCCVHLHLCPASGPQRCAAMGLVAGCCA